MKKVYSQYKDIFLYTALWLLLSLVILGVFCLNGKTFLIFENGVSQNFNAFYYLCNATETWMTKAGKFDFYSFCLGQGADVIITLNNYGLIDFISILSSMCSFLSRVNRYTLMIFIKLWLVGISFIYYLRSNNKKDIVVNVAGALIYAFATVNIYSFLTYPNYINWAYFLPFILGSVELYKHQKLRIPLIVVIALNVITSYYTFFMNAILTFIYVFTCSIIRCLKAEDKKKELVNEIIVDFKLLSYCLVGIGISTVILLPVVSAYRDSIKFIKHSNIIFNIFILDGISSLLFAAVIVLFLSKRNIKIKLLAVTSALVSCLIIFGQIYNDLNNDSITWLFSSVFYLALICTYTIPLMHNLDIKQKIILTSTLVVYSILNILLLAKNWQNLLYLFLIIAGTIICSAISHKKYFNVVILLFVIISLAVNSFFLLSPIFTGYVNSFAYKDELDKAFINSSSVVSDNREFYRVETAEKTQNLGVINDVYSTTIWYSLLPHNISDYYYNLGIIDYVQNCNFLGLDGRSTLLKLASVKYYTKPKGDSFVPSGFVLDEEMSNDTYEVYRNINFLPIAYTYDNVYSYEDVEQLNGIQKELVMLQGAIIDTDETSKNIKTELEEVDYSVVSSRGISYEDGIRVVQDNSAYIELESELSSVYETYLYFSDVELIEDDELYIYVSFSNEAGSFTRSCSVTNLKNKWPAIKKELSFYLGNNIDGKCSIRVSFNGKAKLKLQDVSILRYNPSAYLNNLNSNNITNVVGEDDMISCHIDLKEKKYLQFSIPYSKGWEAYVDGIKTDIEVSDYMYMGFYLDEGLHEIELRYEMPYYKDGKVISLGFMVLAILIGVRDYHTKKDEEYGDW